MSGQLQPDDKCPKCPCRIDRGPQYSGLVDGKEWLKYWCPCGYEIAMSCEDAAPEAGVA